VGSVRDLTYKVDKLTVLRPASVMAETARKRLSMNRTLWLGVEDPQKIIPARRHVAQK
jgi:hypothetical protein